LRQFVYEGHPMSGSTSSHETDRGTADQRLALAVSVSVRTRCGRSLTDLAAVARQGVVTLHGQVRSYYQKQVMLTAALGVPGVEQLIDHVEVLPVDPEIHFGGAGRSAARSEAHSAA
jgi:osmotically-inducible protein OsmY